MKNEKNENVIEELRAELHAVKAERLKLRDMSYAVRNRLIVIYSLVYGKTLLFDFVPKDFGEFDYYDDAICSLISECCDILCGKKDFENERN